jgi:hypothetical protein
MSPVSRSYPPCEAPLCQVLVIGPCPFGTPAHRGLVNCARRRCWERGLHSRGYFFRSCQSPAIMQSAEFRDDEDAAESLRLGVIFLWSFIDNSAAHVRAFFWSDKSMERSS